MNGQAAFDFSSQITTEKENQPIMPVKTKKEERNGKSQAISKPIPAIPIIIASGAVGEMAAAITQSVGSSLHQKVDEAVGQAVSLATITDNDSYLKAAQHRQALQALVNKQGDPNATDRLKVRISLGIMQGEQDAVAIAAETTIGTVSVEDLYGPLANLLFQLHLATTQEKKEALDAIDGARQLLATNIIGWERKVKAEREEAERKQRLIQEQKDRTERARHWMSLLSDHGFTDLDVLGIIKNPIETVTDSDVSALESKLREKLEAEEREKQERELKDAIDEAERLGMKDVAEDLRRKTAEPVAVEAPLPPPPPRTLPAPSTAAPELPKVKGVGTKLLFTIKITDPARIPAQYLLPPDNKLHDPEAYPRLRAMARAMGKQLQCPGIEVIEETRLTR